MKAWRLPPRFKRKAWEHRHCVAGLDLLQVAPGKVRHEAVRVKPKMQWRPQEGRDARLMKNVHQVKMQAMSTASPVQERGHEGFQ
jgi:hypothetical protein